MTMSTPSKRSPSTRSNTRFSPLRRSNGLLSPQQSVASNRTTRSKMNESSTVTTTVRKKLQIEEPKKRRGRPPKNPTVSASVPEVEVEVIEEVAVEAEVVEEEGKEENQQITTESTTNTTNKNTETVPVPLIINTTERANNVLPATKPVITIPINTATNQKFTDYETDQLLKLLQRLLPCGKPEWENLAIEFNKLPGVRARSYDNLRRKYNSLVATKPPTGDASMPEDVRLAKDIKELMFRNSNSIVLGPNEDVMPITKTISTRQTSTETPDKTNSTTAVLQGLANLNSEKLTRRRPGDSELTEFLKLFLVKDKEEQRRIDKEIERKERKERRNDKKRELLLLQQQQQQQQQMMMFMAMMVTSLKKSNNDNADMTSPVTSNNMFAAMPTFGVNKLNYSSSDTTTDSSESESEKEKTSYKKKRKKRKQKRKKHHKKRKLSISLSTDDEEALSTDDEEALDTKITATNKVIESNNDEETGSDDTAELLATIRNELPDNEDNETKYM